MNNIHKILIFTGLFFILAGTAVFICQKLNIPLGRLPGDIVIKKDNFSFYFPITTCALISIVLSIVFYLVNKR